VNVQTSDLRSTLPEYQQGLSQLICLENHSLLNVNNVMNGVFGSLKGYRVIAKKIGGEWPIN